MIKVLFLHYFIISFYLAILPNPSTSVCDDQKKIYIPNHDLLLDIHEG